MNIDFKDILSNELKVWWDEKRKSLIIEKTNKDGEKFELVQIREKTFNQMSLEEASKFLGERFIILMPWLRGHYNKEFPFPDPEE